MVEVVSNHDGEFRCGLCGHQPGHLVTLKETQVCQHCLADAAARLAFETGHYVCGTCRAFVHCGIEGENLGTCRRRAVTFDGYDGKSLRCYWPMTKSDEPACEERLPRDRFRAGAAPGEVTHG